MLSQFLRHPVFTNTPLPTLALVASVCCLTAACNLIPDASDFEQSTGDPPEPPVSIVEPPKALGFTILTVEPDVGAPKGLELLEIRGAGFREGARVFFDGSEAVEVTVTGSELIYAITPPHSAGFVTVRVVNPDATYAELAQGFAYASAVEVHTVTPTEGPVTGGLPVQVTGRGFTGAAALLFEGRQAIDVQVIDDNTILAILPTGIAGHADVHVVSQGGIGRLDNGFKYFAEPTVGGISPLAAPTAGGGTLSLAGAGLISGSEVAFADTPAELLATSDDGSRLVVRIPPGQAGPTDLTVTTPHGSLVLPGVFHYLDGTEGIRLLDVWPRSGPASGGGEILLVVTGLATNSDVRVWFGENEVDVRSVVAAQNLVLVQAPPGTPGTKATVTVSVDGTESSLSGAYAYTRDVSVDVAEPDFGHISGGTVVRLSGAGFDADDLEIDVGALPAESFTVIDASTVELVTPPGSTGLATIRVRADGVEASLKNGFRYEAGVAQTFAMSPQAGAIAGNTWAVVYGTDLPPFSQVYFGDTPASYVEWLGPEAVAVRTPRAEDIGEVDVRLEGEGHVLPIPGGYTYFDPTARFGGTWGDPIDGSLNVTVLEAGGDTPVTGAVVVIGSDNPPRFKGYTDDRGQVTLSGPDLEGRIDVTAAKFAQSAASVIAFDAENVTLTLVATSPPSSGGGGEEPLLPGKAFGTITGVGKYLLLPPWPCDELHPDPDGQCQSCVVDDDCGAEAPHCTSATNQPRFCARACSEDVDCLGDAETVGWNQQYVCRGSGPAGAGRCVPNPGKPEAWCFPSGSSIMSSRPSMNQYMRIDLTQDARSFSLENMRLGEVAVYCVAGGARRATQITGQNGFRVAYTPNLTDGQEPADTSSGELVMHAQVLGMERHAFILPGAADPAEEQPTEVVIPMDIPLTRSVNVMVGEQPIREAVPHETSVSATIDLGSDGYIPLAIQYPDPSVDALRFGGLPQSLTGLLYDAEYAFYGAAVSTDVSGLPTSEVLRLGVDDLEDGAYVHYDGAAWNHRDSGYPGDIHAVVTRAVDDAWAVTRSGAVVHWDGDGWGAQPIAGGSPLNGITDNGAGGIIAVGDNGRVVRYDGDAWRTELAPTQNDLRDVAMLGPAHAVAVGAYVIVESKGGIWSEVPFGPPKDLRAVWSAPSGDLWAVGGNGAMVRRAGSSGAWSRINVPFHYDLHDVWGTADGALYAVGARGQVLVGNPDSGWEVMQTSTRETLRGVWGLGAHDVYAVGDNATVVHWDGTGWATITEGQARVSLRGISGTSTGSAIFALGAQAVHLGPFLHVQDYVSPQEFGTWNKQTIRWVRPDAGADPTFHSMRLYGPAGNLMWNIMAPGWLTGFELPDLDAIEGLPFVQPGRKTLIGYTVDHPGFSIDAYDSRVFSLLDWHAWVVLRHEFDKTPSVDGENSTVPGN